MALEAVIFDAEGVVVDTEPIWDEGQRLFLARRGIAYDREKVKPLLTGRSLIEGTRLLADLFALEGPPAELAEERAEIVRDLMADVQLVPGFSEFFSAVRGRFQTCVATAMAEELFDVVDRKLGIRDLFAGRVYTLSDVGQRAKPDPALFLFASAQLEVPPPRCVVIEDSPLGIEAAHRAGIRVVGLATTYRAESLGGSDLVADGYSDLDPDRLEALVAG
ncbi:MAG TPA: HAD family phosphatase [Solirubrobacterales bacterium]